MKLLTNKSIALFFAATALIACGKDNETKKLDTTFKLDPTEVSLSAFGGSQTVILGIGKDIQTWDFAQNASAWYTVNKNSDGISFTISAGENIESHRTAQITCVGNVTDGTTVEATVSLSQDALADDPMIAGATSLNADGVSANCYIVSKAGTYRFIGNRKGNGENLDVILNAGFVEMEGAPIEPASAKLIWQDRKGLLKNIFYIGGQIFFSTAETFIEGNALIAALDESGKILWSWHIWLTDAPGELKHVGQDGKEFIFLDRNLGATAVATAALAKEPEAYGLLYQQGRKEPLRGGANWDENTKTVLPFYDMDGNDVFFSKSPDNKTGVSDIDKGVQIAIENPTIIYAKGDTDFNHWSGTYTVDVCLSEFKYLWGRQTGGQKDYNLGKKTIFDPCPAGYMVASVGSYINESTTASDILIPAALWSGASDANEFRSDAFGLTWSGQPVTTGGNTRPSARTYGYVGGAWKIIGNGWENCMSIRCLKDQQY